MLYRRDTQVLLGVGKRVMWEEKFKNTDANFNPKHLVVIASSDQGDIGLIIQDPDDCYSGVWDEIVPMDVFLTSSLITSK